MLVVAEREQLPVRAARAGSSEAWDALFKRYQMPLYVYVFELIHNEQSSLDIVQETFINAARHIGQLREDHKFGSWLFGIAHQKCIQLWREKKREQDWRDQFHETKADFDDDPAELLIRKEQELEFMTLLERLPLPQRSVLLLHFIENFSLEAIAAITGTEVGTVKSRMHYGKKAFRKLIQEQK